MTDVRAARAAHVEGSGASGRPAASGVDPDLFFPAAESGAGPGRAGGGGEGGVRAVPGAVGVPRPRRWLGSRTASRAG